MEIWSKPRLIWILLALALGGASGCFAPSSALAESRPPASPESAAPAAQAEPPTSYPTIHTTYENKAVEIHGIRFERPDAPVVILQHGLTSSAEAMTDLGRELYAEGFEVWMFSFTGHGAGKLESVVRGAKKGDLGVRKLILRDMPAIVQHVRSQTGNRKLTLVGHSLGAIVSKMFMSGVTAVDGKLGVDPKVRAERGTMVDDLVLMCAPTDFHDLRKEMKVISTMTRFVSTHIKGKIPSLPTLVSGEGRVVNPELAKQIRSAIASFASHASGIVPKFIVELNNLTDEEIVRYLSECMSAVNSDVGFSLNNWIKNGFKSQDGFDYGMIRKIHSRTLILSAEHDGLAPPQSAHKDAVARSEMRKNDLEVGDPEPHGEVYEATLKNGSHGDAYFGKAGARTSARTIASFILRRHTFSAPPGRPLEAAIHPVCDRPLGWISKAISIF